MTPPLKLLFCAPLGVCPFVHYFHRRISVGSSGVNAVPLLRNTGRPHGRAGVPAARRLIKASISTSGRSASVSTSLVSRLEALRDELHTRKIEAFIIPSTDPHNSEYPATCFERRAFISGFTGSAGTAVVTQEGAYLWTDGRYFLQAEQELDGDNWQLMKAGLPDTPTIPSFLAKHLPPGSAVGIDPLLYSVDAADALMNTLNVAGSTLFPLTEPNPVDVVWGPERPPPPQGRVRPHDVKYAGKSVADKLSALRSDMKARGAHALLFSMLDETAWLYNIRGEDVPHCPVVLSYAMMTADDAYFYVDGSKLSEEVKKSLLRDGITVRPYAAVLDDVALTATVGPIWFDPASTSTGLALAAGDNVIKEATPVPLAKATKNEAELAGMRAAHVRDGVALSSFLCWLENEVGSGRRLTEVEASDKLESFRAMQEGFLQTSFGTIAGIGANGAIIHYTPVREACADVTDRHVFLIDSGGQYMDGTTDVTRTIHLGGRASEYERVCFTRVLKGHINLDCATFPEGTTGFVIDVLARSPLWSAGLDYRHGTGHGVGACLNVHEGPQSISQRLSSNKAPLKEGMIVSNEPGYYENGQFGIRIENLLVVVKKETEFRFGDRSYLGFDRLTFVPIDKNMIIPDVLSKDEINWLDSYHNEVWRKLSPHIQNDDTVRDWLWEKTRPLALNNDNPSFEAPESSMSVPTDR